MMQPNMMGGGGGPGPGQGQGGPGGGPQQQQMGQMQMMHRGSPTMHQQQVMMGPGGQMHHQHHSPAGPDQQQMQARMQMDSMHAGQSPHPHQHPHQQQGQPGQGQGPPPGVQHGGGGPGGGGLNPHEQQKLDNISKAKQLLPNLKESCQNVLRTGAQLAYNNNMVDSGSKPVDVETNRFERAYEEFSSVCDQMEMHLRTSIECLAQGMSSQRYLPTPVTQTKMDQSMTYPQYLSTVKGQIAYAKEVHDLLTEAAQKMVE